MDLSRRDLFKRASTKGSLQAFRILIPTGLARFLGIADDSRPSAGGAHLGLRRTKKAKVPLKLLRMKHPPRLSRGTSALSKEERTVSRDGNRDREGSP